jgi:hypothetical protein
LGNEIGATRDGSGVLRLRLWLTGEASLEPRGERTTVAYGDEEGLNGLGGVMLMLLFGLTIDQVLYGPQSSPMAISSSVISELQLTTSYVSGMSFHALSRFGMTEHNRSLASAVRPESVIC